MFFFIYCSPKKHNFKYMKFQKQFIYLIKIQKKIFGNKIYKNLEMVFLNFLIK